MLGQNINLVLLLELVSSAMAAFFALIVYLSVRQWRDILLHQRIWLLQSGKKEVPMMLGGFATIFWFLSAAGSVVGLGLSSYVGATLYGGTDPGGFGAVIAAVVGLLAVCAGIRDASAKWRELYWQNWNTILPLAQNLGTKIELATLRSVPETSGAQ